VELRETYQVTEVGNSLGVNCFKPLERFPIPTGLGSEFRVIYRENGPDGDREIVLKPNNE